MSLNKYCTSYSLISEEEDLNQEEIKEIFTTMHQALREYIVGKIDTFDKAIENCFEQNVVKNYKEQEKVEA